MAEVKMDLSELKALEDKVTIANNTIKKKEEEVTDLKLKMKELEANKRIVERTIIKTNIVSKTKIHLNPVVAAVKKWIVEHIPPRDRNILDSYNIEELKKRIGKSFCNRIIDSETPEWQWNQTYFPHSYPDEITIGDHGAVTMQDELKTEYINFEEVISELRKNAEESVSKELGTLRSKVNSTEASLATVKANYKDEVRDLQKQHNKEIEELKEASADKEKSLRNEIEDWSTKYEALKEDKDTRSNEEKLLARITELEDQLAAKEKSWWKKLF